ncbi:MAG: tetratricopeptide repeat protein [Verrucomicrobia bacterium]|nr:tetratricopeptide repeat protein [Verrucomicrobiota bacterium]
MRRALKIILLLGALIALLPGANAAVEVRENFSMGNALYERGKFAEAAAAYDALVLARQVSPAAYFNLGNARLKNGELGRAIAAYLAAERLDPRDGDVKQNLQFARTTAGIPFSPVALWRRVFRVLTVDEWSVLASLVVWLLLTLLTLRQLIAKWQRPLTTWMPLAGAVAVMLLLSLGLACLDRFGSRPAVVAVKEATARFGPVAESQSAFTLNDGAEVAVVDATQGWLQIRDLSGRTGWVKQEQVALVQ